MRQPIDPAQFENSPYSRPSDPDVQTVWIRNDKGMPVKLVEVRREPRKPRKEIPPGAAKIALWAVIVAMTIILGGWFMEWSCGLVNAAIHGN